MQEMVPSQSWSLRGQNDLAELRDTPKKICLELCIILSSQKETLPLLQTDMEVEQGFGVRKRDSSTTNAVWGFRVDLRRSVSEILGEKKSWPHA